jgi:hypothetical protein
MFASVAALALGAVASPARAEARGGLGAGLAGGLIAGAVIGGIASNAYGYGPGYGYYGDGYAPVFYYGSSYYEDTRQFTTAPVTSRDPAGLPWTAATAGFRSPTFGRRQFRSYDQWCQPF